MIIKVTFYTLSLVVLYQIQHIYTGSYEHGNAYIWVPNMMVNVISLATFIFSRQSLVLEFLVTTYLLYGRVLIQLPVQLLALCKSFVIIWKKSDAHAL